MTTMDHKKGIHYLIMEVTSYNQMAIMIAKLTKTKKINIQSKLYIFPKHNFHNVIKQYSRYG